LGLAALVRKAFEVRVLYENNHPFVIALYPHPGPSPSGRGVLNPAPLLPREKGLGDEGKGWTLYSFVSQGLVQCNAKTKCSISIKGLAISLDHALGLGLGWNAGKAWITVSCGPTCPVKTPP
jgi:hypothetical protein